MKQLYVRDWDEIINIHGELGSRQNPIIFGYGDELDDDYKRIEKLQDNDFLENRNPYLHLSPIIILIFLKISSLFAIMKQVIIGKY